MPCGWCCLMILHLETLLGASARLQQTPMWIPGVTVPAQWQQWAIPAFPCAESSLR